MLTNSNLIYAGINQVRTVGTTLTTPASLPVQTVRRSLAPFTGALPINEVDASTLIPVAGAPILLHLFSIREHDGHRFLPALSRWFRTYQAQGLRVIAVHLKEPGMKVSRLREVLDSLQVNFPVFFDERGEVAARYHHRILPTTYALGQIGNAEKVVEGTAGRESLERALDRFFR